jgi:hypothetical protein
MQTLQNEYDNLLESGEFDMAEERRYTMYWVNISIKKTFRDWENEVEKKLNMLQ